MERKGLEWKGEYSVGVAELDTQHKTLIEIINHLAETVSHVSNEAEIRQIVADIVAYKNIHFATEEKYFKEFDYTEREEHERRHHEFSERIEELKQKHTAEGSAATLAFEIVDFLEDWFVQHLLRTDKRYTECFHQHGLE